MNRTVCILCLSIVSYFASAQNIIITAAGNGTPGRAGDSGLAAAASFYHPAAICFDQFNNYYVADEINCLVRKINFSTGIITTVAGNGVTGYSGDSGLAVNASLNYPNGVSLDALGRLYIADAINHRIRMVDLATNIITTIAGNGSPGYSGDAAAATSAKLNIPEGLYADYAGNVFIADAANNAIRKYDVVSGTITTIAGNGNAGYSGDIGPAREAQLNDPNGVCKDNSGNLYIADTRNSVIRKVSANGIITTYAGNGACGYAGDGGLATDAELDEPMGVGTDDSGNVFIADNVGVVRKIDKRTGIISTIAGTGSAGYSGDGGSATAAQLNGPNGLAIDKFNHIYIADEWNNVIRAILPDTNYTSSATAVVANDGISVRPNPSGGKFVVEIISSFSECSLNIFTIAGKNIYHTDSISRSFILDMTSDSPGIYILVLTTAKGDQLKKLIEIQ